MTSLPSVPMDALLEPPPSTSDPLDAIFNLQRRRSNSERQRRTLLDIASSRSFRQVVRFASIDADLIQWKKRTVESVRTASLRAIHLQEKLDIKRQASVRHLDTERVTLTEWQQPHDLDDDDDDDLSDAAHTLLSIPATSTTAPPAPVKEEYKPIVHHSGWLIKRGHRNWSFKRRLFCLVGHELVYHDSHQAAPANVLGKFDLRKPTSACELANHGFTLRQGSYEMLLYASCDADRDLWLRKLADCSNVTLLAARPASSSTSSAHDNDVLLHAGWLRKQGQFMKSVKRRYFRLTAGALTYYRGPDVVKAKGSVGIGPNTSVALFDTRKTGERHSFCITENTSAKRSRVLTVFADSQEDLMIWVASLSAAIDGHHQRKRSHSSSNNQLHDVLDCDTVDDHPSPTLSVGSSMSDNDSDVVVAEAQSKTDIVREIAREAQLILISPYSPEGTTSTKFLKDTSAKTMHLDAIRHFIEGLTEYMIQTRMHEFRAIAGIDDNANNSTHDDGSFELIAQIISEQVEERVFYPLHRIVYTSLMTKTKKDVRFLQDRLELLRAKKQVYFGIMAVSPSGYAAAVAVMNEIDACSLPYTKRAKLVQACKTIYAVAAAEHLVEGAMSADAFIPAFIYVVVQCHIEDILTLKDLLVAFTPMANQGETAYFVTCLEIAIEYVQSLVVLQELELDGDAPLGLEFAVEDHVVVVNRVLERSQAAACGGVDIGDVLMAINGLSADDKELVEVKRIFESVQGPVALSFVKKDDYKRVKARCQLGTGGRESAKS